MLLDYPLWLRAAHFFNFLLLSLLVRSGLEILSAHPRLYWNDHCTPGSEWLKFTKKQRPDDRLWTASDEETSFPSAIALPGHENLGLGRHWHFRADFRVAVDGFGIRGDALRHARVATTDSDFLAYCPRCLACHAELSRLPHRGNTGSIQRITAIKLRGSHILARAVQHSDGSSPGDNCEK